MLIQNDKQENVTSTHNVIYYSALQSNGYISATNNFASNVDDIPSESVSSLPILPINDLSSDTSSIYSDEEMPSANLTNNDVSDKTSINLLSNFIHSLDNPHGLTGSWAIIPFINDVFSIEHDYSRALKYFGDIVNPGLYDYLKQKTIESFISRNITLNELPWEGNYLQSDIQEKLLNFQIDFNGITTTMGHIYEQLYHDIINIIAPPINQIVV